MGLCGMGLSYRWGVVLRVVYGGIDMPRQVEARRRPKVHTCHPAPSMAPTGPTRFSRTSDQPRCCRPSLGNPRLAATLVVVLPAPGFRRGASSCLRRAWMCADGIRSTRPRAMGWMNLGGLNRIASSSPSLNPMPSAWARADRISTGIGASQAPKTTRMAGIGSASIDLPGRGVTYWDPGGSPSKRPASVVKTFQQRWRRIAPVRTFGTLESFDPIRPRASGEPAGGEGPRPRRRFIWS